jgi:hypothetical protein
MAMEGTLEENFFTITINRAIGDAEIDGLIEAAVMVSSMLIYNTPQKLDRGIRCMLACHNREAGMA